CIYQIANIRIAQVQGTGFPVLWRPDGRPEPQLPCNRHAREIETSQGRAAHIKIAADMCESHDDITRVMGLAHEQMIDAKSVHVELAGHLYPAHVETTAHVGVNKHHLRELGLVHK